jgi:hypothetical protein
MMGAARGYQPSMTSTPQGPDQDAEPPTPDGEEPDLTQLDPDNAEPGSDPDPDPGRA